MHTLAGLILDRSTNGAYFKWLDSLIDRVHRPENFEDWRDQVYSHIRLSDFRQMDKLMRTESAGYIQIKTQTSDLFTQLGFRMILRAEDNNQFEAKMDHFQWCKKLSRKMGFNPSGRRD